MPAIREIKGRCPTCRTIYQWLGAPKLCDARCPSCQKALERCRQLDPGKKVFSAPAHA